MSTEEKVEATEPVEAPPETPGYIPSFSVIVPTWGEHIALGRTLANMIIQQERAELYPVEVLVIGDGFEEEAKKVVASAKAYAAKMGRKNISFGYAHLTGHSGSGNFPRRQGIKLAKNDFILFIDAGTSVCHDCFPTLGDALSVNPDTLIVTWDMVQMLEPVPITTTVLALTKLDRKDGLPYVLPGCATGVRRELAQSVEWPNVGASDWAYFSEVWKKAFGTPEDKEKSDRLVLMIPWTLTVAYGAAEKRRVRWPIAANEFVEMGYDKGFDVATSTVVTPEAEDILRVGEDGINSPDASSS